MKRHKTVPPGFDVLEDSDRGLRLKLARSLYSDEVIFKTCYVFTGRCTILLDRIDAEHVVVNFNGSDGNSDLRCLAGEFANELIDQRVRADIARETGSIRELIVSQAFAEADFSHVRQASESDPPASS